MHYVFEGLRELVSTSGPKSTGARNKWVDASILLRDRRGKSEGIDAVVEGVDYEVGRKETGGSRT
jgi:hypothetical protein